MKLQICCEWPVSFYIGVFISNLTFQNFNIFQIVTNVWNVFLREQYKELQKQIQEQHKEQVKIVNQSAVQLEKLKLK